MEEEKKQPEEKKFEAGGSREPAPIKNNEFNSVLDEEVNEQENIKENKDIDEDDFRTDSFDNPSKPIEEKKAPENKENEAKNENNNTEQTEGGQPNTEPGKEGAVKRLMKPGVLMAFADTMLVRAGSLVNKEQHPDHWRFNKQDKADLQIILGETIEEEKWSGIRSLYLLIIVLALIVWTKWQGRNDPYKPNQVEQTTPEKKDFNKIVAETKSHENKNADFGEWKSYMETMKKNMEELQKQNAYLKEVIETKLFNANGVQSADQIRQAAELKNKMYGKAEGTFFKGYDLSKITFTKNGAIVDASKIGTDGWTDRGVKNGRPTPEDKEVKEQWEIYQAKKEAENLA